MEGYKSGKKQMEEEHWTEYVTRTWARVFNSTWLPNPGASYNPFFGISMKTFLPGQE